MGAKKRGIARDSCAGGGIARGSSVDVSNLLLQLGKILLGHHPDLVQVEAEVFVHEYIPQCNNLRSLDLGITFPERLGDATGSLANDL
jgi:hypothetical protein